MNENFKGEMHALGNFFMQAGFTTEYIAKLRNYSILSEIKRVLDGKSEIVPKLLKHPAKPRDIDL